MSIETRMDRLERQLRELPDGDDKAQVLNAIKSLRSRVAEMRGVRRVLEEPADTLSKLRAGEHIESYQYQVESSVSMIGRLIAKLPTGEMKDRIVELYAPIIELVSSGKRY